jgi:hypothetical protein
LFYYPITDYKSWANGLLEAGFSGNPTYADTLISIIEKYYLMHYDRKVAQKLGDTVALRAMQKPQPERVGEPHTTLAQQQPAAAKPAQQPVTQPVEQPAEPIAKKEEPAPQKPVETPKEEKQKTVAKSDAIISTTRCWRERCAARGIAQASSSR